MHCKLVPTICKILFLCFGFGFYSSSCRLSTYLEMENFFSLHLKEKLEAPGYQPSGRLSVQRWIIHTFDLQPRTTTNSSALGAHSARRSADWTITGHDKVRQQRSSPISSEVRNRLLRLSYSSHIQNI